MNSKLSQSRSKLSDYEAIAINSDPVPINNIDSNQSFVQSYCLNEGIDITNVRAGFSREDEDSSDPHSANTRPTQNVGMKTSGVSDNRPNNGDEEVYSSSTIPTTATTISPTRKYKDVTFAILYLIHLLIFCIMAITYGSSSWTIDTDNSSTTTTSSSPAFFTGNIQFTKIIFYIILPASLLSICTSYVLTSRFLPNYPTETVAACFAATIPSTILFSTILILWIPSIWTLLISIVLIGITIWNVRVLWRFVPFAASNLNFACKGIAVYAFAIYAMAICLALFAWLWFGAWIYVINGYYSTFYGADPTTEQGAYQDCYYETGCAVGGNWVGLFFLFLSLYWTISILLNATQTTIAGVIGTYCFEHNQNTASTSSSTHTVLDSIYRSFTYSFGSICFGSLLYAIIVSLRALADNVRNSRNRGSDNQNEVIGALLYCLIQCILMLLQDIIDYFNQWAYVLIGIYGMSYIESGKAVLQLFESRGLTAIITNSLVQYVLNCVSIFSALASGSLGLVVYCLVSSKDDDMFGGQIESAKWIAFWISFVVGIAISSVMMNVLQGAVKTVIVCYADHPAKLQEYHPKDTKLMSDSWIRVYPELTFFYYPVVGTTV